MDNKKRFKNEVLIGKYSSIVLGPVYYNIL